MSRWWWGVRDCRRRTGREKWGLENIVNRNSSRGLGRCDGHLEEWLRQPRRPSLANASLLNMSIDPMYGIRHLCIIKTRWKMVSTRSKSKVIIDDIHIDDVLCIPDSKAQRYETCGSNNSPPPRAVAPLPHPPPVLPISDQGCSLKCT